MSQEEVNNAEEQTEDAEIQAETTEESAPQEEKRRFFTRRNGLIALGLISLLAVSLALLITVSYRYGVVDNYVKEQFRAALADMGIVFTADEFRLTVNPLQLSFKNATFNNKKTGDKIFRIGNAKIDMTVTDLYQLQFERNIDVKNTEINDLEAWVMFDENGNSNFDGIEPLEGESSIKFKYASSNVSLRNSLIHFGETTRKISGDAKNVQFFLEPIEQVSEEEILRYKFDFTSTDSTFTYDGSKVEPINISASGIANQEQTEIKQLKLTSPIGETVLNGTIRDYKNFKYDLKINSTVDLTQTSNIFPLGTAIVGVGNFEGTVTGEGEDYKVEGEISSDSLAAANIRLKALKVNAAVDGNGAIYNAQGKAVAELLTFEDFQIEFPTLVGNIRGNGTDFKWFGELQAVAAKSPLGTIGGLYVTDAVAEYKDKKLIASLGNIRTNSVSSPDARLNSLQASNVRITNANGVTNVILPNARANKLDIVGATILGLNASNVRLTNNGNRTDIQAGNIKATQIDTEQARLKNVTANNINVQNSGTTNAQAGNVRVGQVEANGANVRNVTASGVTIQNTGGNTNVKAGNVRAENVQAQGAKLKDVTARNVTVQNSGNRTDITAQNIQSDNVDTDQAKLGAINASGVDVRIVGDETNVYSNNLKIAKVQTDAATLGSLNIAGVRLSIKNGRVEARSNDFNAGDVTLAKSSTLPEGGKFQNVSVSKPVFVLEPSGRYRASLDMSLGGGTLGSINLGAARASVLADNDSVALNNLDADIMEGKLEGNATIALSNNRRSDINVNFANLDLGKLLALQGGRVIPIEGQASGNVDLSFNGTNFKRASGNILADIAASAGNDQDGLIPLTGKVSATANNGLFALDYANLNTEKTSLNATGSFDLNGYDSNLNVALNSNDASEIEKIIRVLNISPELEQQLDEYQSEFAGNFVFTGNITGNITNPIIDGRASLDSLILRNRDLGSLVTRIYVSPEKIELNDGILQERDGGNVAFNVSIPTVGENNIAVNAKLNNVNTGSLLSALPIDILPDSIRDLQAQASGTLNLTGLPNNMQGEANITAKDGSVNGQSFDNLEARAIFSGNQINLEKFNAKFGEGFLNANGTYNTDSTVFNFDVKAQNIPVSRLRALLPKDSQSTIKDLNGIISLNANATGRGSDSTTYNINFDGTGENVVYDGKALGRVTFKGETENQQLNANVTANFRGQQQVINGSVNFADANLPFKAETIFDNTQLGPYISIFRPEDPNNVEISGTATGRVFLEGTLTKLDNKGERVFTTENIGGAAQLSQLSLQIAETPLVATSPVNVRFNSNEVVIDNAQFSGGGSNLVINGTKALTDNGINNLAVDGKINLRVLNALSPNVFFSGLADVAVRLTGVNKTARLNGVAQLERSSVSTFVGSERLTLERLTGRLRFTTNQVQIDQVTGFLGGGRVNITGGLLLTDGLELDRFRLEVRGNNVTAPLPPDFITTGNADIQVTGRREGGDFSTLVSGTFLTRRSVYTKDIDLASVLTGGQGASLSQGSSDGDSILGDIRFDVRIIGRDAFVIRNNLADLTASADLRVAGDIDFPQISGRITANRGTIFFRDDRYEILRGTLTFPPNSTEINPIINLQAETEINGYQIFVNLNGNLTDTDSLNATLRSNPSLPQADVVSLVTTGSLANTGTGIPTYAQGGINTAAEILTDEIINKPIAKATDKLFGLNKFELDPIVSGQRSNPTARLTVGRQINRNLLVTYSTNLSEDQNQVIALEYRVSNKISVIAQYEQRSLSNVTQRNNNFSFEVRFRKRF
ncbi:MAG: translocation/assembly module TamB domain-containing protein [Acidobacteriota bacterium]|nr:translocation/assembly module TamB domain-containing protein [Acidobacteriota bacterium]